MKITRMLSLLAAGALLVAPATACAQYGAKANAPAKAAATSKSIVDIAAGNADFSTLVAALKAAGLVETLQGPGPFTVFAPTNAAFAKLPAGTVEALLADKEKLTAILTYHVVGAKVMAGDIVKAKGANPATVNGGPLAVVVREGKVSVNGAQVTTADIVASNGVIHVIDTVLLPPAPAAAGGR
jgi:uncharacterized surface protein with fasciclin (FAS1) repeats